jgi:hypothetical protein
MRLQTKSLFHILSKFHIKSKIPHIQKNPTYANLVSKCVLNKYKNLKYLKIVIGSKQFKFAKYLKNIHICDNQGYVSKTCFNFSKMSYNF